MSSEDYERTLGVIEAFTVITKQCPNAAVRTCAEQALEAVKRESTSEAKQEALQKQAFFVLSSIRGWRGERSAQVQRSLREFLDTQ